MKEKVVCKRVLIFSFKELQKKLGLESKIIDAGVNIGNAHLQLILKVKK